MRRLLLFLALAHAAFGAVAFDAVANTGSGLGAVTSTTFTLTIVGNTNIGVVVGVAENVNSSGALTVTVNGTTANVVSGTDSSTAITNRVRIYCVALGSTTGAVTVSVSGMTSNDPVIGAVSFTGVNQTTPCAHGAQTSGNFDGAGTKSLTITSATNDYVLWQFTNDTGNTITGANQTEKWNVRNSFAIGASGEIAAGAATVAGGYASQPNAAWCLDGVDIQVATGGGGSTPGFSKQKKLQTLDL